MTQAITGSVVTSFAGELAELLLNVESAQSDAATLARDAARKDFLAEAELQVDALHAAADDVRNGAWASAAFTVASSAFAIEGAVSQYDADMGAAQLSGLNLRSPCDRLTAVGLGESVASDGQAAKIAGALAKGFGELAPVAKSLVGDAAAQDANASAHYFETLAEKAKWLASDASREIDQVARQGDKLLEILQSLNQDQNSANNALIGRI